MSDIRVEKCVEFLRTNASSNKFYASVLAQFDRYGTLSVKQLEAVERGMNTVPNTNPVTEIGMYEKDGVIYRVKFSDMGRLYALRFVPEGTKKSERYQFAKGAIAFLSATDRMTVERCAKLGVHYSMCVICGADLSDPKSVARGMGPVCASKV